MSVSLTNLSREGKCIKFQFGVYPIYQRLARKAVQDQDELHEDEDDQDQVQEDHLGGASHCDVQEESLHVLHVRPCPW